MVRIFDPENQADFRHRMTFNFDRNEDDLNGEAMQTQFLQCVNQGRALCSAGMIGEGQIPYTISDPHHPLLLIDVTCHDEAQLNIGTQLIMDRKTCYIKALIAGGSWRVVRNENGSPVCDIEGAELLPFGVSYQREGGLENLCNVGGGPLLKALRALHSQQKHKWRFHYAILCVHIAESLRFHGIASTVSRGLGGWNRYNYVTLTDNEQKLVTSWKLVSKYYMINKWAPELREKTGIASVEDLPQHAALLLRIS